MSAPGSKIEIKCKFVNSASPSPRCSSACQVINKDVYFIGGEFCEWLNPVLYNQIYRLNLDDLSSWQLATIDSSFKPRVGHASAVASNLIYLHGGEADNNGYIEFYNDFWSLDTKQMLLQKLHYTGSIPYSRSGHRMFTCKNFIGLFGGYQQTDRGFLYYSDLYMINPQLERIKKITMPKHTTSPCGRSGFYCTVYQEKLYLLGGYTNRANRKQNLDGTALTDVWILDLKDISTFFIKDNESELTAEHKYGWSEQKPLKFLKASMAFCASKHLIFFFGGVRDRISSGTITKTSIFYNDLIVYNVLTKSSRVLSSFVEKPNKNLDYGFIVRNSKLVYVGFDDSFLEKNSTKEIKRKSKGRRVIRRKPTLLTLGSWELTVDPKLSPVLQPLPRLSANLFYHNNCVYLTGGFIEFHKLNVYFDDIWEFNIKTSSWRLIYSGTYWQNLDIQNSVLSCSEDEEETNKSVEKYVGAEKHTDSENSDSNRSDLEDSYPEDLHQSFSDEYSEGPINTDDDSEVSSDLTDSDIE